LFAVQRLLSTRTTASGPIKIPWWAFFLQSFLRTAPFDAPQKQIPWSLLSSQHPSWIATSALPSA
jgi:hypothetical protein